MFSSCCKDQNPNLNGRQCNEPEYIRLTLEGADKYLVGKPGSYWIYENTQTGDLDTQTCINYSFTDSIETDHTYDLRKQMKQRIIFYDKLRYQIKSSFNNWVYRQETRDASPASDLTLEERKRVIMKRTVVSEGIVVPFFYPFEIGLAGGGTGSSFTTLKEFLPTYLLKGKTYTNVAVFEIDSDDIWYPNNYPDLTKQYPNSSYYWAENVGLIKRENQSENYAWELIEYNIIK